MTKRYNKIHQGKEKKNRKHNSRIDRTEKCNEKGKGDLQIFHGFKAFLQRIFFFFFVVVIVAVEKDPIRVKSVLVTDLISASGFFVVFLHAKKKPI